MTHRKNTCIKYLKQVEQIKQKVEARRERVWLILWPVKLMPRCDYWALPVIQKLWKSHQKSSATWDGCHSGFYSHLGLKKAVIWPFFFVCHFCWVHWLCQPQLCFTRNLGHFVTLFLAPAVGWEPFGFLFLGCFFGVWPQHKGHHWNWPVDTIPKKSVTFL